MTVVSDVKTASAPFDDAGGDTILRTCDGVEFRVYRIILTLGSPFFRSMFSLKQPSEAKAANDPPIIDVSESSRTLDHLLRLCYPIPDPVIESVEDIGDVLEAAIKYDMDQPTILMKASLRKCATDHPLEVYAVACRLHMEADAASAASIWYRIRPTLPEVPVGGFEPADWRRTPSGQTYIDSMSHIPAGPYFRLCRYVADVVVDTFCYPDDTMTEPSHPLVKATPIILPDFDNQRADVVVRSSDGVEFPVHRNIVAFASSVLDSGTPLQSPSSKSPPIIQVDEHSAVLNLAIQLCYPLEDPVLTDPDIAIHLLHHATRHKARRAKDFVRRQLAFIEDLHPLRIFFIAAQQKWEAEARMAVLRLLHSDVGAMYVPEMEEVSADVYRSFLKYHYECYKILENFAFRDTGTSFLFCNGPVARLVEGYARVAPTIYSPTVNHAITILKSNPMNILYNLEAMRRDSERKMDEIQVALMEVELTL